MKIIIGILLLLLVISCIKQNPFYDPDPLWPPNLYEHALYDSTCKYEVIDSVIRGYGTSYAPLRIGDQWHYYYYYQYERTEQSTARSDSFDIILNDTTDTSATFAIITSKKYEIVQYKRNYDSFDSASGNSDIKPLLFPLFKSIQYDSLQFLMDNGSYAFRKTTSDGLRRDAIYSTGIGGVFRRVSTDSQGDGSWFEYILLTRYNGQKYDYCSFINEFIEKEKHISR